MTKKQLIILAGSILLCASVIVLFSMYYTHRVLQDAAKSAPLPAPEDTGEERPAAQKSGLTPVRPEDYGMIVINERNKPRTQEEWDRLLSRRIKEAKSEFPAETLQKVKAKIAENPDKTKEKLRLIDDKITKCKETLSVNPGDQGCKDTLDRLMILKSIAKELP